MKGYAGPRSFQYWTDRETSCKAEWNLWNREKEVACMICKYSGNQKIFFIVMILARFLRCGRCLKCILRARSVLPPGIIIWGRIPLVFNMFWKLFLVFLLSTCFESCSCFDPEGYWSYVASNASWLFWHSTCFERWAYYYVEYLKGVNSVVSLWTTYMPF